MQIRSAQNVGKVWISRKKSSLPISCHFRAFVLWAGKMKKMEYFCLFSLVGQWPPVTRFGVMCWCHCVVKINGSVCQLGLLFLCWVWFTSAY